MPKSSTSCRSVQQSRCRVSGRAGPRYVQPVGVTPVKQRDEAAAEGVGSDSLDVPARRRKNH